MRLAARGARCGDSRSSSRSATRSRSRRRRPRAAAQRLDPGQQFGEGEGLGEVVVAAGAQALTRSSTSPSAERNSTGVRLPCAAQRLDQRRPSTRRAACGRAPACRIARTPRGTARRGHWSHAPPSWPASCRPLRHEARDLGIVLDQQNPHRVLSSPDRVGSGGRIPRGSSPVPSFSYRRLPALTTGVGRTSAPALSRSRPSRRRSARRSGRAAPPPRCGPGARRSRSGRR